VGKNEGLKLLVRHVYNYEGTSRTKMDLREWLERAWTGFVWLMMKTSGGL
jgi:hypothetical protein